MRKIILLAGLLVTVTVFSACENNGAQPSSALENTMKSTESVIKETEQITPIPTSEAKTYAFEHLLDDENPDAMYEEYGEMHADIRNSQSENFMTTSFETEHESLIIAFVESLYRSYTTFEKPDISRFYDLSNQERRENKMLVEEFMLQQAENKSNIVTGVTTNILIKDIQIIDADVLQIAFYTDDTLHTDDGDEGRGRWYVVHILSDNGDGKIIKCWVQDFDFAYVQQVLQGNA